MEKMCQISEDIDSWRNKMDKTKHGSHEHAGSCCCSRRTFLATATGAAAVGPTLLRNTAVAAPERGGKIEPKGPASKYVPKMKVTFVRREEEYGMRWPGAVYDGEAALKRYRNDIERTAKDLGIRIDIRPKPIYSTEEADAWVAEAKAAKPDGLLVVLLDRQEHSWPTAYKAVDSKIPTIVFAPLGAAFTTNTWRVADQKGCLISCTDSFSQAAFGMKMIKAGAKLRETRFIVLRGDERNDTEIDHLGTKLRYIPASTFLEEYNKISSVSEVNRMAEEYVTQAISLSGPTEQDVRNGLKSYLVARNILEKEEGDAITMDCLGAVGPTSVSLPCIAWSKMLDDGIPAACEADLGACVSHALVLYLFDRPGFQQDPVPETTRDCLIGAHCTCPTRLNGVDRDPEPFFLSHHHGNRDAVPVPTWRVGQRMTSADILLGNKEKAPEMIISAGTVVENISVPPSGGCVVSVMVKLDDVDNYLGYPGFHQIFFYGDYKKQLREYCKLYGIEPRVL